MIICYKNLTFRQQTEKMNQQYLDSLREALKQSPDNLPLRKMLAETLLDLARYEEAAGEFKEALRRDPDDSDLKFGLVEAFYFQQKFPAARMVAEEILESEPEDPDALVWMSKILLQSNELKGAKEYYDQAIENDPSISDPAYETDLTDKLIESGLALPNFEDDFGEMLGEFTDIEKPKISFKDVGGMESIKEEIALKVIHPIRNPEIYRAYGKKIGGGILLYGPPGCGKTMLARATAGEINAGFISVGINEVLDMWVGNSEKNLHDIFQSARVNAPCVLFFDEVDAMGASRTDMRKNNSRFLINQFLDEMDGVRYSNEGVLVLAATNSPWYLDAAFRRPGRFDRIVFVAPPDLAARQEILKIQLADKPTDHVDILAVAKMCEEYSGADLKAVVDLAVEAKIPESLRLGKVLALTTNDLKQALGRHRPTTREWFATAKNYALYSNEGGLYDDILKYLKIKK